MSESVTITLPLPSANLSPNARCHWRVKAKAAAEQRFSACARYWACYGGGERWKTATGQATFYFKVKRRRDKDNLNASLKNAVDGLVDARVLVNDEGLWIVRHTEPMDWWTKAWMDFASAP